MLISSGPLVTAWGNGTFVPLFKSTNNGTNVSLNHELMHISDVGMLPEKPQARIDMTKIGVKKRKTRETLLDTAEELFAHHGYDGVSVRDITEQAGTRLAAINYYFNSKKSLYVEVIVRRAHDLSSERLELLHSIEFEGLSKKKALTQLMHAFTDPLLKRSTEGGEGWKNYCLLIAQIATLRFNSDEAIVAEFNPPALEFVSAIRQVLPNMTEEHAHYAFQFVLATTLYVFTENNRIDTMSAGKFRSSELQKITNRMIEYQVGGVLALVT